MAPMGAYVETRFDKCTFLVTREKRAGQKYENVQFTNCRASSFVGESYKNELKTFRECENLSIDGFRFSRIICTENTIFRHCSFRNISGEVASSFDGVVFDWCTFTGSIVRIKIAIPFFSTLGKRATFIKWLEREYESVRWAIDISNAEFPSGPVNDVILEGIPGEKVIRRPENTVLLDNRLAALIDPEKLKLRNEGMKIAMTRSKFLKQPQDDPDKVDFCKLWDYEVLVNCGRTGKERTDYDRDFDKLCKVGIAFRENPSQLTVSKPVRKKNEMNYKTMNT